jgi:hydroxyethylthiazole kinase-like uncharacterized protein yjeF
MPTDAMTEPALLHSVAAIRQIEQAAQASLAPYTLMQNAGAAAAQLALQLINRSDHCGSVLILAGPGNNGGDALETGLRLDLVGIEVSIAFIGNADALPADAAHAWQRVQGSRLAFIDPSDHDLIRNGAWDLVIDGLFGIGLKRAIDGSAHDLIALVNTLSCPILALDVSSGLDADRGTVVGNINGTSGIAIAATHTLSFIADKPGLHTADGRDYAGQVYVTTLGIEERHFPAASTMQLNRLALFADMLQRRRQNSHKGSFGKVFVIGGAAGMTGAAILAARTALKCGAGRVYIASLDPGFSHDGEQPELMRWRPDEVETEDAVLIVGPGLGNSREAHDLLSQALASKAPLVLDADALNLLASESGLQHKLSSRLASHRAATLLTPHPLEAARLLGVSSAQVQADRLHSATAIAKRFNAVVILKGSGTVIADPDGKLVVNTTGNPGLATAGSGDVLAGLCGALLAQHWPLWQAAIGAVWLHGQAADDMVADGSGPIGIAASELIPYLRRRLNQLAR